MNYTLQICLREFLPYTFQPSFSEAYFTAQKQKKTVTSNKTMSGVKLEQTSVQELAEILENIPENHKKEKEALFKKYCSQFDHWDSLLEYVVICYIVVIVM